MGSLAKVCTMLVGLGVVVMMSQAVLAQTTPASGQLTAQELAGAGAGTFPGQQGVPSGISEGGAPGVTAAITTTLTVQSHQIGAGVSAGNLEGAPCPAPSKMISGACHPFYNDRVPIINQFPNIGLNAWRCGFKNNTASPVTVYIYTLCGQ